jgi:hypothetical protein
MDGVGRGSFLFFPFFFGTSHTPQETDRIQHPGRLATSACLKNLVMARVSLSISKPFIMNTIIKFTEYGNR